MKSENRISWSSIGSDVLLYYNWTLDISCQKKKSINSELCYLFPERIYCPCVLQLNRDRSSWANQGLRKFDAGFKSLWKLTYFLFALFLTIWSIYQGSCFWGVLHLYFLCLAPWHCLIRLHFQMQLSTWILGFLPAHLRNQQNLGKKNSRECQHYFYVIPFNQYS